MRGGRAERLSRIAALEHGPGVGIREGTRGVVDPTQGEGNVPDDQCLVRVAVVLTEKDAQSAGVSG